MDKVFLSCWGKSHFLLCASTCYVSLALAKLDVELVWSVSLKSDCWGQKEPQFGFQGEQGAVSAQPLEALRY